MAYLRHNGFKVFIVSGGGIEFMRPWTEEVYGVPPEQVVGSSVKTEFQLKDGKVVYIEPNSWLDRMLKAGDKRRAEKMSMQGVVHGGEIS